MIRVFGRDDRAFSSNGDKTINPLKAIVRKEDNGDYYLELSTDLSYLDYLVEGNILVADTPQGSQPFRIRNIQRTRNKINLKAYHVFYDTMNYLIEDTYIVDRNCDDALSILCAAAHADGEFDTLSDITVTDSYRCVRTSLFDAIQVVLERWGGHLVRDGFDIKIMSTIGVDNGVTVRYRKDLEDITCEETWDDVVNYLLPVGQDGILLNDLDSSASLYVTAGDTQTEPRYKSVNFTQEIDQDEFYVNGELDETAYKTAVIEDLRMKAQAYADEHCRPRLCYALKANPGKITDIGDTVQVIDERLGLELITAVTAYEYDCIQSRYTLIEFGSVRTLSGLVEGITDSVNKETDKKVETTRVSLTNKLEEATGRIWNAMSNSNVIYDGDKILIVDKLPKEEAQYCILINSGGIGFSATGINGTFNSAWTIDGTLDMQAIEVINLTANLIRGGTLMLGAVDNQSGILELYDEDNNRIGLMDKDGLRMFGSDGSYVLMNNDVGFAGYDASGTKIYWADADEFHMKKSVVEEEITLCGKVRFIPITITQSSVVVNDGIGLIAVSSGGDS